MSYAIKYRIFNGELEIEPLEVDLTDMPKSDTSNLSKLNSILEDDLYNYKHMGNQNRNKIIRKIIKDETLYGKKLKLKYKTSP